MKWVSQGDKGTFNEISSSVNFLEKKWRKNPEKRVITYLKTC